MQIHPLNHDSVLLFLHNSKVAHYSNIRQRFSHIVAVVLKKKTMSANRTCFFFQINIIFPRLIAVSVCYLTTGLKYVAAKLR